MIAGNAITFVANSSIPLISTKIYLIALFCQLKSLNFRLKRCSWATSKNERIIQITANTPAEINSPRLRKFREIMNGIELIKKAFAGVGSPIKFSDCLSSILNFASRRAEKAAIMNPT